MVVEEGAQDKGMAQDKDQEGNNRKKMKKRVRRYIEMMGMGFDNNLECFFFYCCCYCYSKKYPFVFLVKRSNL